MWTFSSLSTDLVFGLAFAAFRILALVSETAASSCCSSVIPGDVAKDSDVLKTTGLLSSRTEAIGSATSRR